MLKILWQSGTEEERVFITDIPYRLDGCTYIKSNVDVKSCLYKNIEESTWNLPFLRWELKKNGGNSISD